MTTPYLEFYRPDGTLQFTAAGQTYAVRVSGSAPIIDGDYSDFLPNMPKVDFTIPAANLTRPIIAWKGVDVNVAPLKIGRIGSSGDWKFSAVVTRDDAVTTVDYVIFDVIDSIPYTASPFELYSPPPNYKLAYSSAYKTIRVLQTGVSYPGKTLGFILTNASSSQVLEEQDIGDVGESEEGWYNLYTRTARGAAVVANQVIQQDIDAQIMEYDFGHYPPVRTWNRPAQTIIPVDLTGY
jgi:hypothetical protein